MIEQSHNLKYFRIDNLSRIVKSTLKANALVVLDTILSNINEEDFSDSVETISACHLARNPRDS